MVSQLIYTLREEEYRSVERKLRRCHGRKTQSSALKSPTLRSVEYVFIVMLLSSSQWMGSGSRGPCGQVALKPVEEAASRGTGFVMGPFLEGRPVLESEKRSAAVMKRDVQVCGQPHFFTVILYHAVV